jgi:hypothetical protein
MDNVEKTIHKAFSEVQVDEEKLAARFSYANFAARGDTVRTVQPKVSAASRVHKYGAWLAAAAVFVAMVAFGFHFAPMLFQPISPYEQAVNERDEPNEDANEPDEYAPGEYAHEPLEYVHEPEPHTPAPQDIGGIGLYVFPVVSDWIVEMAAALTVGVFEDEYDWYVRHANILETRINSFTWLDAVRGYDLARIDFSVRTDDLEGDGTLRWGTFSPDSDGWVGHHTGWNEARTVLVFSPDGDIAGTIEWWEEERARGDLTLAFMEKFPLIVWDVPPNLPHERIYYCFQGFSTEDHGGFLIDPTTGEATAYPADRCAHGPLGDGWIYDPALGLIGWGGIGEYDGGMFVLPLAEMAEWLGGMTMQRLFIVQLADTTLRDVNEERGYSVLAAEGRSGRFAVMYQMELVTDFIFTGGGNTGSLTEHEVIPMAMGDSWGMVDTRGESVIPFVFEHILLISPHAAFAKFEGNYGILNIPRTAAAARNTRN